MKAVCAFSDLALGLAAQRHLLPNPMLRKSVLAWVPPGHGSD